MKRIGLIFAIVVIALMTWVYLPGDGYYTIKHHPEMIFIDFDPFGNCTVTGKIWLRSDNDYDTFIERISPYVGEEKPEWNTDIHIYPAAADFTFDVPNNDTTLTTDPFMAHRAYTDIICPYTIKLSWPGQAQRFQQEIRIQKAAFPEWQDVWCDSATATEYFIGAAKLGSPSDFWQLREDIYLVSNCNTFGDGAWIDAVEIDGYPTVSKAQFPIEYPFGFTVSKDFDYTIFHVEISGCAVPVCFN